MNLVWCCPTWNRPLCVANLVRQFLVQEYPADQVELLILNDSGMYESQSGDDGRGGHRWQLISIPRRFHSLPEKYNALLGLVGSHSDAVIVAEDDDLYSPLHTSACAAALAEADFSKPSQVLMTYKGKTSPRDARGRFHASMAMRTQFLRSLGGWPVTSEPNYDKQLMSKLSEKGRCGDPIQLGYEPTYTYVWDGVRGHGSAFRNHGADWYDRAAAAAGAVPYIGQLFSKPVTDVSYPA